MAVIARRHIARVLSASALAAALALPTGLAPAAAAPQIQGGSTTDAPELTMPGGTPVPPPTPDPPPPPNGDTPPPPNGDTPPPPDGTPTPDEPPPPSGDSPPPPPSSPDDTPSPGDGTGTDEPPGSEDPAPLASQLLTEQQKDIDEAAANLAAAAGEAPRELDLAVRQLTTTLEAAQDPETSPQARDEVTGIADEMTYALTVMNDPQTSAELREQLIVIVQQVASALEVNRESALPAESRTTILWSVKQATSTLETICDPKTPSELREPLSLAVERLTGALEGNREPQSPPAFAADVPELPTVAHDMGVSLRMATHQQTPPEQRVALAKTTAQVGASLARLGDPSTAGEERRKTRKALGAQSGRMKDGQNKAGSAHGLPDVPLGKAAESCTNALFSTVPERSLARGLNGLLPLRWKISGVQDFWKVRAAESTTVDVFARLQNGKYVDEPFDVGRLTTHLAELVPAETLTETVGDQAGFCLRAASHLGQQGTVVGSWLEMAQEKQGDT
ncbi:hypothetical protein [Streptomyces sp. NPDC003023]|uniref:hypothetical protein n=1 Tax=Streptomyces sp. NPDC003023 TaxID=3364675 RepID=UPI0036745284